MSGMRDYTDEELTLVRQSFGGRYAPQAYGPTIERHHGTAQACGTSRAADRSSTLRGTRGEAGG
jgi:hypothetical protein